MASSSESHHFQLGVQEDNEQQQQQAAAPSSETYQSLNDSSIHIDSKILDMESYSSSPSSTPSTPTLNITQSRKQKALTFSASYDESPISVSDSSFVDFDHHERSVNDRLHLVTPNLENNEENDSKQSKKKLKRFEGFLKYLHRELNVSSRAATHLFSNDNNRQDSPESVKSVMETESTTSHNGKPYNFPNSFVKLTHDPKDNCFTDEELRSQMYRFVEIPIRVERFLFFGFFICLDTFLFYLTFFPVRVLLSLLGIILSLIKYFVLLPFKLCLKAIDKESNSSSRPRPVLHESVLFDIVKFLCLLINIILIMITTDYSLLYHYIRGESILKLYVIGNMLDVFDKLCSAFGLDSQIAVLYSAKQFIKCFISISSTQSTFESGPSQGALTELFHFVVTFSVHVAYLYVHSIVQLIRIVTLNAALNSSNYTLLTMIISTNFVELKGSVFKRFTKENLFQLACSDVVERFELFWFTLLIIVQNTLRTIVDSTSAPLTGVDLNDFSESSIAQMEGNNSLFAFLDDKMEEFGQIFVFMIFAEVLVDTLKHTFVSKFNNINPSTFKLYTLKLCDDLISHSTDPKKGDVAVSSFFDNTNRSKVARRLGFLEGPLITHTLRMILEVMLPWLFHFVAVFGYNAADASWSSSSSTISGGVGGETLSSSSLEAPSSISSEISGTPASMMIFLHPVIIVLLGFACLFLLKLLISIIIIGHAAKRVCLWKDDPNNHDHSQNQGNGIPNFPDRYMMYDKRIP
ncbi:hypothetical protein FDP41_004181 [Naegleria fowleri]|uniref:Uncharacterized protein n=1 Tax=Naegleria fowleri TaxID=5763 RepID=A0A6A5BPF3_NAEFO|nr:uncharacterized protein FDP41_004181 [Naegleria fowleri]KAF0976886.1 hypothetical protein FDP41_004181 [Naegleria fowleri]CAG4712186.1 unnamed protein product [Naegleria fowleri]